MKDYIVPCEKDPSHIGKQSDVKFRSTIEFAPQDLFHKALNPKTPFSDLAHALLNPLKGLRFMHIRGYVHADVKMENVLVFENGEGKLADLGFSGRIGTGCSGGTLGQFSSLFYGKGGLGLQLSQDMFSFGHLLLATMACKRLSLGTVSSQALCWTLTLANVERLRRKITSEIHREYIRLIQTTLREAADKPEYRPLYHLVADLISYNPNERPDSTETERRLTEDTSPAAVAGHSC